MTNYSGLQCLAAFIKQRNDVDMNIAKIIGRPALPGHLGEFVAARIFDVELLESASHKGIDGHFIKGPLAGQSVNIKYYPKNEGLLDITLNDPPSFYLVLAGPRSSPSSSRGTTRPWVMTSVFLFNSSDLVLKLKRRRVKIGTATSVIRQFWNDAEIYPSQNNVVYQMNSAQRSMIELFA